LKKNVAIILAGGTGERFGADIPKQFVKLAGKPIIYHTIEAFEKHPLVDEIFLVVHKNFYHLMEELISNGGYKKIKKILLGGSTRQESSRMGIVACDETVENVLIHDAVRPFVSNEIITETIIALANYLAVDVAIPSTDTIVEVSSEMKIKSIPTRKFLLRGQTPQGFKLAIIKKAHELAISEGYSEATDDCSLVLRYNLSEIFVVSGSDNNIKITEPIDIHIADKIFQIHRVRLKSKTIDKLKEKISGKVLVVFGGTSGIGQDICKIWQDLGGHAYEFSRRTGTDITKKEDIDFALSKVYISHRRIDSIVCSAAILKMGFLDQITAEEIISQINTNFIGSVLVAKSSIPYIKESKGSLILFASSSYTRGRRGYTLYSASKAALVNFVQGLSDEMSCFGVRVSIINPERTNTQMRRSNFGNEDKALLLSSKFVAKVTIDAIVSDLTGCVIDARKNDEGRI
jgi:ribitol-5-phosphate 2-dehydrogenase (NADP+) / D-ribitol-5-phosphate cytidylyltransferase